MPKNLATLLLFTAFVGCGGKSATGPNTPPPPPPPAGGPMTATVDGQSFGTTTFTAATHAATGSYVISAQSVAGLNSKAITLILSNISGTGTYPLGTGAGVEGGLATYVENGAGWGTPLSGQAGTITLTTLTDTRIKGSFSFTATEHTGGATGTRTLTGGTFDLALTTTGTFAPVPESRRNIVSATIDGRSFKASTVASLMSGGRFFVISSSDTKYAVSFSFDNLTAPGTYPISSLPAVLSSVSIGASTAEGQSGPDCCWSSALGGTGSVVVTSVTPSRVTGTFAFTLNKSGGGATGPVTVTGGSFSLGRDPTP